MELILAIIMIWIGFLVVEIINKLAHFPTKEISFQRILPIPKAVAWGARFRWGGMLSYLALAVLVAYFKPDYLPVQVLGLIAWFLFITHGIIGSLNYEIPLTRGQLSRMLIDDIPNNLWWVFIPAAIIVFCLFCQYYWGVISILFNLG